jgi:signal transduction histidine kinase
VLWFLLYKSKFAHDIANPKEKQKLIAMVGIFLADTHPYDTVESLEKTLQKYLSGFVSGEKVRIFDRVTLHRYPGLFGYFTKHTAPITRESETYRNYAEEIDAEIMFPLYSENEHVIGLLLLGPKADGSSYSQEDSDIISRILLKLSLSLQVLSHNLELRLEVLKQTGELRKKNEELATAYEDLKKVDKQKDAFLAIASHELRTPMTIIKGYSDMLLK